jgi:hypothetical protein
MAPPEFRGNGHEILGAATGRPRISRPVFGPVFAVHSVYFARNWACRAKSACVIVLAAAVDSDGTPNDTSFVTAR